MHTDCSTRKNKKKHAKTRRKDQEVKGREAADTFNS